MEVGFVRVSTQEQELDIQLTKLNEFGCERIFQGKHSSTSVRMRC
ncbi:recombinase family protein [Alteromonas sp. KS69]